MSRQSSISAVLQVVDTLVVTPQTVVALPPSSADPAPDLMRLRVNGIAITRPYDSGQPVPIAAATTWDTWVGTWDEQSQTWEET